MRLFVPLNVSFCSVEHNVRLDRTSFSAERTSVLQGDGTHKSFIQKSFNNNTHLPPTSEPL